MRHYTNNISDEIHDCTCSLKGSDLPAHLHRRGCPMLVEKPAVVNRNDPSLRRYFGLSPFPEVVVRRLNVHHLSIAMGDHHYVWRAARPGEWGPLLQWRSNWWDMGSWYVQQSHNIWTRIANVAITALPGERFIRVGQVVP